MDPHGSAVPDCRLAHRWMEVIAAEVVLDRCVICAAWLPDTCSQGHLMARLLFLLFLLIVMTVVAVVTLSSGFLIPKLWGRLFIIWIFVAAIVLLLTVAAVIGIVQSVYHHARGRRDRSKGIPCARCGRLAFPVEGTTDRYRCPLCGCRFDGPGHLP